MAVLDWKEILQIFQSGAISPLIDDQVWKASKFPGHSHIYLDILLMKSATMINRGKFESLKNLHAPNLLILA